jgi:hypothetical protein
MGSYRQLPDARGEASGIFGLAWVLEETIRQHGRTGLGDRLSEGAATGDEWRHNIARIPNELRESGANLQQRRAGKQLRPLALTPWCRCTPGERQNLQRSGRDLDCDTGRQDSAMANRRSMSRLRFCRNAGASAVSLGCNGASKATARDIRHNREEPSAPLCFAAC